MVRPGAPKLLVYLFFYFSFFFSLLLLLSYFDSNLNSYAIRFHCKPAKYKLPKCGICIFIVKICSRKEV